jgi:sarcosine oxidase
LTAAELRRRFPAWQPPDGFEAVYQADSGIVGAERAIYAHLAVADRHGAELWARTRVTEMSETSAGVVIETSRGRVEAGAAIITAGPWAGDMLPALHPHLTPERQVVGWFQPRPPERFVRGAFPVFIVEDETGNYYGFPIHDRPGVKLARHGHQNEATTPDTMRRTIDAEDEAVLSRFTRRWFGDGLGQALSLATCLYTNTPDNHFVIDSAPGTRNTWVAAGFSGHGYKFCAGVGEILADLATTATTRAPVHLFRASRFAAPQRV